MLKSKFYFIFLFLIFFSNNLYSEFVKCRVINKELITGKKFQKGLENVEQLKVQILTGDYKNKIAFIHNYLWGGAQKVYNIYVNTDDIVIADLFEESGKITGYTAFYWRSRNLIIVLLLFSVIIIAITRKKGFFALASLFLIYFLFIFIFIPLLKKGISPVLLSFIFAFLSSLLTLCLVLKNKVKTFSALFGTLSGLFFGIILTVICFSLTKITGFHTTYGRALILFAERVEHFQLYSLKGLFIAGIVITCIGAVMDISAGVTSSVYEIHKSNTRLSFKKLFFHGFSVGKDVIATMVNTLVFVTITQLLVYVIVFKIMKTPFIRFSNYEFFILILLYGLISSITLILTVPLTVLSSAVLLKSQSFKWMKPFLLITFFFLSFFFISKLYAWIQPPDYELHYHPVTKMYKYQDKHEYSIGKIVTIENEKKRSPKIQVKIINGYFKNKILKTGYFTGDKDIIKKDASVVVWIKKINHKVKTSFIVDNYKFFIVYYLSVLLIFLLFLVCGKWIKIFLSLSLAVFITLFLYTSIIIKGFPIIWATIITSLLIVFIIIAAISKNKQVFKIAFLSCVSGIVITFFMAFLIGRLLKINGFSLESFQMLNYYNSNYNYGIIKNIHYLIFALVVLGALGALMDVVITICSTLNEIKIVNPTISFKKLFKHGMDVGSDLTGTMVNTLILAYTGFNLGNILIWSVSSTNMIHLLNLEFLSVEITRALAGALGFIIVIPITSFISGMVLLKD